MTSAALFPRIILALVAVLPGATGFAEYGESVEDRLSETLLRVLGLPQTLELDTRPQPGTENERPSGDAMGALLPGLARSAASRDRLAAMEGLSSFNTDDALALLIDGLFDESAAVRSKAADGLLAADEARSARALSDRLLAAEPEALTRAADVLPRLHERAEGLIAILADDEAPVGVMSQAALCAGRIRAAEAGEILAKRAWAREATLARHSAWALATLADSRWTKALDELLRHPLPEVRYEAMRGLSRIGGSDALMLLANAAVTPIEPDASLRRTAIYFIAKANEPASIDALISVLERTTSLRGDTAHALQALTRLPYSGTIRPWREWYTGWKKNPVWPIPMVRESIEPMIIVQ